jgi:hypothetical protein
MGFQVGPRVVSATGGSIKRVGNYRIHTFPSELVTDGLVFNLDAGDPRSYPGSGTTWTDLSGYNQTGTLTNGPTYNNANGGSFAFSKAGLKYSESTASAFNITGANAKFTLEAWARNTTDGVYNTVLSIGTRYAQIGFHANATFMYGSNGGGGNNLIFHAGHTVGNWYHLVMTFEGLGDNIAKFYVNGSLLTSGNIGNNGNTTTTSIRIGAFATSGTEFLDGNVAVARVYNKALSAAEVAQNYDALKVRYTSYTNTFTPLCGGGSGKVEVLCVAGGGGGGSNHGGGGGGAGGLLYNSALTVSSNTGIGVTIGAGGTAQINGGNTIFSSLTSIGGGTGATEGPSAGNSGGSGGGGTGYTTPTNGGSGTTGQGFAGGRGAYPDTGSTYGHGGGGGGAGSAGTDGTEGNGATAGVAGTGGNGLSYSITGNSQFYAGGGGGGFWGTINGGGLGGSGIGGRGGENGSGANTRQGGNAIPNTGSGGGGSPGIPGINNARVGGNGSNGIVIVRYPATDYNVELLVVGGGAGGGGNTGDRWNAGGGGAGGLLYYSSYPVSAGTKYTVTVGAGGIPGISTSSNNGSTTTQGANGGNSILGPLVAIGGGGGGASGGHTGGTGIKNQGLNGGSGGGSASGYQAVAYPGGFGVTGQGNQGGTGSNTGTGYAGGGGGAGGPGTGPGPDSFSTNNFGAGLVFSITGSSVSYAQGGQGGRDPVTNAMANSGTGGDGASSAVNTLGQSGIGGSGIIIIAYQGPQRGIGGTVDTSSRPGYTLHRFTTTGTDFFIP